MKRKSGKQAKARTSASSARPQPAVAVDESKTMPDPMVAQSASRTGSVAPSRFGRWWREPALWCFLVIVFLGLFAPLLANDVPLVARVEGSWHFPAFAKMFGQTSVGPGDSSWKQWWSRLPAESADFAWMPPWPYGPTETDTTRFGARPSLAHPFGNDDTGRDCLARILHGSRVVITLALPSIGLAGLIGTLLGALAGLRRRWIDVLVLRAIEIAMCFPTLLLVLFVGAFFGHSRLGFICILAVPFGTAFARIVRGELLSLRERDFVQVARGLGLSDRQILLRHLLPQIWSKIGVTAAFCMASAIAAESTLSFLGLGPGDGAASWGAMLRQGSSQAVTGGWHLWFFPAATIVTVVVVCHLLADRLRADRAVS